MQKNGLNGTGAPSVLSRKVYLVTLCQDQLFVTDGTTTPIYVYVGSQEAWGLGPYIEDIVIHAFGRAFATGFRYQVDAECSNDNGQTWKSFAASVLGLQSSAVSTNGPAYTTRTDFGLLVRFKIGVRNDSAGQAVQGTLTAVAAIKVWS